MKRGNRGDSPRISLVVVALLLIFTVLHWVHAVPLQTAESLPSTIRDDDFWRMVSDFSEEGGAFKSELMSNEMGSQYVIPELKRITKPGGAYLGVGPEQNFTYLAAIQPQIAFIIDIRRQNMLEHLIYKAVFELSADRAEFVSRLFSRQPPQGIDASSTAYTLFRAFGATSPDPQLFDQNLKAIKTSLMQAHHFGLTNTDEVEIETLFKSFRDVGPGIWESSGNPVAYYGNLMSDTDKLRQEQSYLSSEEKYQIVRTMERSNRVVPLVGDFAGSKTLRALSQYVRDHHATVTVFYISNVEDYLFAPPAKDRSNTDAWRRFYNNVRTLPIDSSSTFIRSEGSGNSVIRQGTDFPSRTLLQPGDTHFTSLLSSMSEVIQAFDEGRIENQTQVLQLSRKP